MEKVLCCVSKNQWLCLKVVNEGCLQNKILIIGFCILLRVILIVNKKVLLFTIKILLVVMLHILMNPHFRGSSYVIMYIVWIMVLHKNLSSTDGLEICRHNMWA
jgi:hypothetical protein